MINFQYIKTNAEKVKQNIINRKFDPKKADIDKLLQIDAKKNKLQIEIDSLRAKRNELSKIMGNSQGKPPVELLTEAKQIKESLATLESQIEPLQKEFEQIMQWLPNMVLDEVPVGKGELDNIEISAWHPRLNYLDKEKLKGTDGSKEFMPRVGTNADSDFTPIPHYEIGVQKGLIDLETGSKVSGSRFYYLKNEGVLLMYALFDKLIRKLIKDGFTPMYVPVLVREKALFGTSHFPADQDQVYEINNELIEDAQKLYLIGSSEPSLFSYHSDKIIPENQLPIKMYTQSTCFRSEAGSWGKDVRGMKRAHQFEKVEMDMIIKPNLEEAQKTLEYLLSINEWLLQELEIPYHVINMCTGDLGYAAAAKKYDIEVFLPSTGEYMEVMSDSITTDFQTRRLNIKCTNESGEKNFAYTVNDTGVTHRLLIAIIEHYQQKDGSIKVPKMLQDFIGKEYIGK